MQKRFDGLSRIGFILLIIILGGANVFGQGSNGAATPQNRNSDHGADQNLKSAARVNPSTLAMEISIPFANFPGRNGNAMPVGISYSSKLWRMQDSEPYFYTTYSGHKQYVTQLRSIFAERSAAGWTSSLAFPAIEEKLEFYTQEGKKFSFSLGESAFNDRANAIMNGGSSSNKPLEPGTAGPANNCNICTFSVITADNQNTCLSWWGWYSDSGNCGPSFPSGGCGTWCDPEPIDPINNELPPKTYYVKRVHVRMGDGSTHEFRKSDAVFGYCSGSAYDGLDCESTEPGYIDNKGMYLAVDSSGMKLERTTSGSVLYLPNGGRYLFPSTASGNFEDSTIFQSTDYIDADGNKSQYIDDPVNPPRRMKDTLGRQIADFLPQNYHGQEQEEGTQPIDLPGLTGQLTQHYELKWLHLKPIAGGIQEGALENQNENIYYYGSLICIGAPESAIYPNAGNTIPDDIMFPYGGLGLRSCNPGSVNNPTRFNPVVLAEVKLPNGKTYQFKYNQFGEITKVIYPTESYETFAYKRISPINPTLPAYDQTNRGVYERRVYQANGTLEQRWQYDAVRSNLPASYKVVTTASKGDDPMSNGIKTEKYLLADYNDDSLFGFSNPLLGMPFEERTYDENGELRSRILTQYDIKGPVPTGDSLRPANESAQRDPRPLRTISLSYDPSSSSGSNATQSSMPDPGDGDGDGGCHHNCGGIPNNIPGNVLATMSETTYDDNSTADPEYFPHLNAISAKSYHYAVIPASTGLTAPIGTLAGYFNAGLLASVSETDYMGGIQGSQGYALKERGIHGLPVETRVMNPSNPTETLAKTHIFYDEYLSAASGNLPGSLANTWTNTSGNPNVPTLRGKPTTSVSCGSDNSQCLQTHTQYDEYGNVRKVWEPNENPAASQRFVETQYAADYAFAYPTTVITPAPDPSGMHGMSQTLEASTTFDFTTGLTLSVTDASGKVTTTEYNDPLLRPTAVIAPNGSRTEKMYNDTAGDIWVKTRSQFDTNVWNESTIHVDSLGRTIKTESSVPSRTVIVETQFDNFGRTKKISNPYQTGEEKVWTESFYDEIGRHSSVKSPDNSETKTEYGISTQPGFIGLSVTTTDAAGKKSRAITNVLGQLIRVDESSAANTLEPLNQGTPNSNPSSSPSNYPMNSTYYIYNEQGKMVEAIQGNQKRFFLYDSLGRLIRVRQPEQEINPDLTTQKSIDGNNQWTAAFSYDILGNMITATDANGIKVEYSYDKSNRMINRLYKLSNGQIDPNTPEVNYFYDGIYYDATGTKLQAAGNSRGALTQVKSNISTSQSVAFDEFGKLLTYQQITDGQTYTSQYQYNLSGSLIQEIYPSGRTVRNDFNRDGDLVRIYGQASQNSPVKTYANSFSYTNDGKTARLRFGNGKWETAKFNNRFQITELGLGNGSTDSSLWKLNYEYGEIDTNGNVTATDKNTGNITKQTINFNGLTAPFVQTYKYDSLDRLTEAKETSNGQRNWQQNWSYDRFGNRLSHTKIIGNSEISLNNQSNPEINSNNNRISAGQGYQYDLNGNIIADADGKTFIFNGDNKQRRIEQAGQVVGEYFYDGEGKRVKKKAYSSGQLVEETVFVYSAGKLVAEYSNQISQNPQTRYLTEDHLGTPRIITNQTGEIIARHDYMPFGEEVFSGIGARSENLKYGVNGGDGVRQKFAGYQNDSETGLDFAEARMYNSSYGRFTAVDPLLASGKSVNPQTFNRYAYVGNNPVTRIDNNGEDWFEHTESKVRQDGTSIYVTTIYWNNTDPLNLEGRTRYSGPGIYLITWGKNRGNWAVLDPYEGRAAILKSRAQAEDQYASYIKDRNVNLARGFIDTLAEMAMNSSTGLHPELQPLLSTLYEWGADAVIGQPDKNSNVYTITNRSTNAIIMLTMTAGGPVIEGLNGANAVSETVNIAADTEIIESATNEANLARSITPSEMRPSTASALGTNDGSIISAPSSKGPSPPTLNSEVQTVMDNAPNQPGWHGYCSEPQCISNALDQGINVRGGRMKTLNVGGPNSMRHLTTPNTCPSCQHLLNFYEITPIF